MKNIFSLMLITMLLVAGASCKSSRKITETATPGKQPSSVTAPQYTIRGKSVGKVSHQYRAGGCATVILVDNPGSDIPLTLIPKDKLPDELDVDGLVLYFDYRTLKMRNPDGCSTGIPAELSHISRK